MIRVYLLDDHEIVRRGSIALLQAGGDIEVIGESGSAREASRVIPALRPDVAVLDVRLPDGNGVEVCRAVVSADPSIKALIMTSYPDDEAMSAAIRAGASGYVLKQIRGTDLVEGIRRIAAGESLFDPMVVRRARSCAPESASRVPPELSALTTRERRILDLIAKGMSNREIGAEMYLAEKTVKNYVSALLAKLGMTHRTQAAILATRLAAAPRE